jgi:hypothetical protein
LRAVEAVDLVHEQQRPLARFAGLLGLGEGFLEVGDAREHRADRHEAHAHGVGQQAGDGGLAGAGRAPQHHARELPSSDHPPDGALGPRQVLLSDHLVERLRPEPVGQRRILARFFGRGLLRQVVGEEVGHRRQDRHGRPGCTAARR